MISIIATINKVTELRRNIWNIQFSWFFTLFSLRNSSYFARHGRSVGCKFKRVITSVTPLDIITHIHDLSIIHIFSTFKSSGVSVFTLSRYILVNIRHFGVSIFHLVHFFMRMQIWIRFFHIQTSCCFNTN